jgi:hypothetical protein
LHEISISKTIGCHFWHGLVARSMIWGHNVLIFGGGGGFLFGCCFHGFETT